MRIFYSANVTKKVRAKTTTVVEVATVEICSAAAKIIFSDFFPDFYIGIWTVNMTEGTKILFTLVIIVKFLNEIRAKSDSLR